MDTSGECLCGCGEPVGPEQKFRPGHDQKLRVALEQEVGGLEALKRLVEGRPQDGAPSAAEPGDHPGKRAGTSFARLTDCSLRDAWAHEARDFTPRLVGNIGHLSDAVGLELESGETEVAVDQFAADVVATDAKTGARVLIENQLEPADHRHLGQVLTYLAGLEAKVVIWVARDFDEAHRSAVRWLNDHTTDEFAFFAVRMRVVRIGDSPFAPIFEVLEKPNTWERALERKFRKADSELTRLREGFWDQYLERHPGVFRPSRYSNVWLPMYPDDSVLLSMYVGSAESGMYLRGRWGADGTEIAAFMDAHAEALERAFGPNQSKREGHYYGCSTKIALQERDRWDELIDWMEEQRRHYEGLLKPLAGPGPTGDAG